MEHIYGWTIEGNTGIKIICQCKHLKDNFNYQY